MRGGQSGVEEGTEVACVRACDGGRIGLGAAVPPGTPAARDLTITRASIAEVSLGQRSLGTL